MKKIILKPGREESLKRRHPWVFSGAIQTTDADPAAGETVLLLDASGKPQALAAYSPGSQIRCRVWSFDCGTNIDELFFRNKLQQAITWRRQSGMLQAASGCRLMYSECDGLPGLIVDRYGQWLVPQFLSAGTEYWKETIATLLREIFPDHSIFERSDAGVREKEHLPLRTGLLAGSEPPDYVELDEHGMRYRVDIRQGHKTGFYLDQRDNRLRMRELAKGCEVLNCFSYTGGFGIAALMGGAERVVNIDSSAAALQLATENAHINGIDAGRMENIEADVFRQMREFKRAQRKFDLIVLDPPKLIDSKQAIDRGARAYKDVSMQAFALLKPGGLLMTFSCSGLLSTQLFQKIVADAALDAGRQAAIIERLSQSADHPVALNFPEGEYLKGLCIRVE
jgi:23S rRNA (cytosine1962-C5)-methyltransferase